MNVGSNCKTCRFKQHSEVFLNWSKIAFVNTVYKLFSYTRLNAKLGFSKTSFVNTDDNVQHSIAGCFKATMASISACTADSAGTDTGAALAPLSNGGTRVRHWQSTRRLWPDSWKLQLPLDDCCRIVLPYPCDPPRMGAKSTTTSNHPSSPIQEYIPHVYTFYPISITR